MSFKDMKQQEGANDLTQHQSQKAREAWAEVVDASVKQQVIQQKVSEWARSTSMHGISKLASDEPESDSNSRRKVNIRRVIWSLLLLLSLTVLLVQVVQLVMKFLSYPSVVKHEEIDKELLQFPAVTVCPLNGLSQRQLQLHKEDLAGIVKILFNDSSIGNASSSSSAAGAAASSNRSCEEKWSEVMANSPSADSLAMTSVVMATSMTNNSLLQAIMSSWKQQLLDCSFYGMRCKPDDFVQFRNPIYGICYTFNFNGSRKLPRPGPMNKLQLILAINQSDQMYAGNGEAGFRVLIHQPGQYPFAEYYGHHVSPGFSLQLGIKFFELVKLPPPYGTCHRYSQQDNQRLNFYTKSVLSPDNDSAAAAAVGYSHKACSCTCFQRRIINICNCYRPNMLAPDEMRNGLLPCDIRPGSGKVTALCPNMQQAGNIWNHCASLCKFSCHSRSYSRTLSFAQFPSESYSLRLQQMAASSGFSDDLAAAKDKGQLLRFMRNSFLKVSIFAESMKLLRTEQEASYELKDLISDCGGQAGFWLGLSVLTVCEIFELLSQLVTGSLLKNAK